MINMQKVLLRWAAMRGFSFEWITVVRPEASRMMAILEGGGLTVHVRMGVNEGHVVELLWGGTVIVRAKTFAGWREAWVLGGEMMGALANYSRRGPGGRRYWTQNSAKRVRLTATGRPYTADPTT